MNWRRKPDWIGDVRRLEAADLAAEAHDFDAAVASSPQLDRFCSSTDWILPARAALSPEGDPFVLSVGEGFVALMAIEVPSLGRTLAPLEHAWGLASPFVGPDPEALVEGLHRALEAGWIKWDALWLSGLKEGGAAFQSAVRTFHPRYTLGIGPDTARRTASLTEGFDGFLSRRSSRFRANLRRGMRAAESAGLEWAFHASTRSVAEVDALFHRVMSVESRSWKGIGGQGMDQQPSRDFYHLMLHRLAARGALRVGFLRRDGVDVACIFGGLFGELYRGLQFSFDDRFRTEGLGNVIQGHMIQALVDEEVTLYDLGTDMPYKRRWGGAGLETVSLVIFRERRR